MASTNQSSENFIDDPISFRSQRYRSIIEALIELKKSNYRKHRKNKEPEKIQKKLIKETSRKILESPLMLFVEIILVCIFTVIITLEMTTNEETHQNAFIAFRFTESIILAFLWFILTMQIFKSFRKLSKKNSKKTIQPWIFLDLIVTILISFPSSSLVFLSGRFKADYFSFKSRFNFFYVLQSLAFLKLFFYLKPMKKLAVKIFIQPLYKLYLLALILLIITVYTIFAIYFFKKYIESENPNLEYQNRFKSFSFAWTTILQIMTFDEWNKLFNDVIKVENDIKTYIFFISWLWVGGFIVAHLYVGVYVDNFIDLEGKQKKQIEKNEKKIQEYRRLLENDMMLQRNMSNEKNADSNQDSKKKRDDYKTEFEDVKKIGLKLKIQSVQLKKLIKEFDKTKAIFKRKKTIRRLDASLSQYGVNDTLMWHLNEEDTKEYLLTLYRISQNLSERNQLRDMMTLVLHEATNHSDQ